jgi:hypothetical protein
LCGTKFYWCLVPQKLHGKLGCDFHESQHALSQHDHRPLVWKVVQVWDRLRWTFCQIWNVGIIRNIAYDLNNPLHKLASTSEKFLQFQTEFYANTLFFKMLHISTCKNCKRHKRQVNSTECTRWLIDVAWSGRCEVKA